MSEPVAEERTVWECGGCGQVTRVTHFYADKEGVLRHGVQARLLAGGVTCGFCRRDSHVFRGVPRWSLEDGCECCVANHGVWISPGRATIIINEESA